MSSRLVLPQQALLLLQMLLLLLHMVPATVALEPGKYCLTRPLFGSRHDRLLFEYEGSHAMLKYAGFGGHKFVFIYDDVTTEGKKVVLKRSGEEEGLSLFPYFLLQFDLEVSSEDSDSVYLKSCQTHERLVVVDPSNTKYVLTDSKTYAYHSGDAEAFKRDASQNLQSMTFENRYLSKSQDLVRTLVNFAYSKDDEIFFYYLGSPDAAILKPHEASTDFRDPVKIDPFRRITTDLFNNGVLEFR
ncbi:hypothetical protein FOL46_008962 [Perkinsus olseni]|uniref:Uncharacterized protein n=1 Tax=Perkinsus olseni TaxID=32597 RepID=A0A7J6L4H0_PEROL|nr:hypothetical protein FOL46_008962 [Perkinsus olseni]